MSWIESHEELPTHRKTRKAARLLNVNVPTVIGHLHVLWYWCLTHCPDGRFEGLDHFDVAEAAGWEGDASKFVAALVDAGWLDDDRGTLAIHDWWDGAGKTIKRRRFATDRQRRARESAPDSDMSRVSHAHVTRDMSHVTLLTETETETLSTKNLSSQNEEEPVPFEPFLEAYPLRNGKVLGKKQAKDQWSKLSHVERERCMTAVVHYRQAADDPNIFCAVKDPWRWLRDRMFDDWQEPAKASSRDGPQRLHNVVHITEGGRF